MEQYRTDVKDALDALLLGLPGVTGGKNWGYPSYKINGKIFAFVGGDGIAIKLKPARVLALVPQQDAYKPFEVSEGVVWKAWLGIDRADPADYQADLAVLQESIQTLIDAGA